MISYEEAKAKAVKERSGLDAVVEYRGAYVFYNSKATGTNTEDNEVVILKSNGKRVSMSEYVITSKDSDKPKKIKF